MRGPLKRPLFRRLLATYSINEMGDWMGIVALSVLVFELTNSPLATAGLFLGTRFLPAFLGPLLVTRVERIRPRVVLPLIYVVEVAAFGVLAVLATHFSLALVIVVATIAGTMALAGRSLTRAIVVALLEPTGELRQGNGLLNIAFTTGAAVGPALAGLVVAGIGVQAALYLNAASFYVVALIIVTAGVLPRAEPEEGGTWDRLGAALRVAVRGKLGRDPTPSGGCLDSQSAKTAHGGVEVGTDGGRMARGRKRHIATDTLGLLLFVVVTAANRDDGATVPRVLAGLHAEGFPRRSVLWWSRRSPASSSPAGWSGTTSGCPRRARRWSS